METITNLPRLKNIASEVNIWSNKSKAFTVELPFLSHEENETLTTQANKLYNTCGCGQGRVAGIFTLIAFVLLIITGIISLAEWGIGKTIGGYFVLSFIIMLITKAVKLYTARREFHTLIANIESIENNSHNHNP